MENPASRKRALFLEKKRPGPLSSESRRRRIPP